MQRECCGVISVNTNSSCAEAGRARKQKQENRNVRRQVAQGKGKKKTEALSSSSAAAAAEGARKTKENPLGKMFARALTLPREKVMAKVFSLAMQAQPSARGLELSEHSKQSRNSRRERPCRYKK